MFKRNVISLMVAAAMGLGASGAVFAKLSDDVVAREAGESARGADRQRDRRVSELNAVEKVAREAGEAGRREDRRQDRRVSGLDTVEKVAREAGETPRREDRRQDRQRGAMQDDVTQQFAREGGGRRLDRQRGAVQADEVQVIAREAGEAARREDRRQGRREDRAANGIGATTMQLARESSEAPRGQDNERPGDRHRQRGRNA